MVEQSRGLTGRKILFYSSYPGFSGSQRMALQLAQAFDGLGAQAIAAAPAAMDYVDRASKAGLRVARLQAPPSLLRYGGTTTQNTSNIIQAASAILPYWLETYRYLRSEGVDLVYAATGRCMLLVAPAARLAGIPVMWHVQGGLVGGPTWLYCVMARLATQIICVSKSVLDDVAEACGLWVISKTSVIYNGIPDVQVETQQALGEGPTVVGFVGNLVPAKGVHHLISAFGSLPQHIRDQACLWVLGPEPDPEYSAHLRFLVENHGIAGQVRFFGYVSDVTPYLNQMAFLVAPSVENEFLTLRNGKVREVRWKEGFGLSALEAMRAAKPVIASNSYGLAEVVEHGKSGLLVTPGDVDALREAMLTLLTSPGTVRKMGESARQRFLSHFTSDRMISNFWAVATETLARGQVGKRREASFGG